MSNSTDDALGEKPNVSRAKKCENIMRRLVAIGTTPTPDDKIPNKITLSIETRLFGDNRIKVATINNGEIECWRAVYEGMSWLDAISDILDQVTA